jgi:hypothetical protein
VVCSTGIEHTRCCEDEGSRDRAAVQQRRDRKAHRREESGCYLRSKLVKGKLSAVLRAFHSAKWLGRERNYTNRRH